MRALLPAFVVAISLATMALAAPAGAAAPVNSGNLISNPGAERTTPKATTSGDKIAVTGWTVAKSSEFTAVRYGSTDFLPSKAPGPKKRGHNFFAGGSDVAKSHATQTISLAHLTSWIDKGKATFSLGGWLGGYSSQDDYATLTVTWQSAAGKTISADKIGPVTEANRQGKSELLHRTSTGKVPKTARQALITLATVRKDGSYDDGYADNLSLVITKPGLG